MEARTFFGGITGLCLFLCRESIRLAGNGPRKAVAAAELAVVVARAIPDREDLVGYAQVHLGNAHRVQGDLPAAEKTLSDGEALLRKNPSGEPLDDAVIFALKASLLRTQGRLGGSAYAPRRGTRPAGRFTDAGGTPREQGLHLGRSRRLARRP